MIIDINRLMNNLESLGAIGFDEGKGTSRPAYSDEFYQGRSFIEKLMEEAGMETFIDGVGNLSGFLPGQPGYKTIAIGSHIDTVPLGGIYDGALGVLAAIEVVRTLKKEGYINRHAIEVIAFNEEEGNVIGGTFGSKAFVGAVLEAEMVKKMSHYNISISDYENSQRDSSKYKSYIELHIEQGGILEKIGKKIGVVQGIVGILRYKATVEGVSNHAGSTPMYMRDDALVKTCKIINDLIAKVEAANNTMVCTIGTMKVMPGAVNVIPGKTEFVIEMRDANLESMYSIIEELKNRWECKGLKMINIITQPETKCDSYIIERIKEVSDEAKLSYEQLFSGAGHDLINMAMITPSALIFIPSKGGISHSIKEFSSQEDIQNGTNVLYHLIKKIDMEEQNEN